MNKATEAGVFSFGCIMVFGLSGAIVTDSIMSGDTQKAFSYLPLLLTSGGAAATGYLKMRQILKAIRRKKGE